MKITLYPRPLSVPYVINTSSAPDHMLGNEVFTDEQATLISTKAAQAEMQQYRPRPFRSLARRRGMPKLESAHAGLSRHAVHADL